MTQQHKLPVFSFAFYLKYRKSPIPTEYNVRAGKQVIHRFTYPVIKLWEYVGQICSGQYRELAPLLVMLVEQPDEQILQTERQLILKETNLDKRADLLSLALTLASSHFDKELLRRLFREEINQMRGATLIDEWLEEAEVKAESKGMQNQLRKDILVVLRIRFALPEIQLAMIEQTLNSIVTLERLDSLLYHAVNDFSIGEFQTNLKQIATL